MNRAKSYAHRERWYSFCAEHCGGTRDPNWHGAGLLDEFLQSTSNHPPLSQEGLLALSTLVEMVKQTVRATREGLLRWRSFCDANTTTKTHSYDPVLLHPDLLASFLEGECPQGKESHASQPPQEQKSELFGEWTAVVSKRRYRGKFGQ